MTSPLKTLLVHLTGRDSDRIRLDAALRLAVGHQARVQGIFVSHQVNLPPYASVYIPAEVFAVRDREIEALAEHTGALFRERLAQAGVAGDWLFCTGLTDREIARRAYAADLVVVGQSEPAGQGPADEPNTQRGDGATINDNLLLRAVRPVLVVPLAGIGPTLGRRVLVGWNDSPEAARAVRDALPLLLPAERVEVLTLDEQGPESGAGGALAAADICRYLARHGVRAEAVARPVGDATVGEALLARAGGSDADLIVAGAYGHSRLFETVLGGVTRTLLQQTDRPLLLSH